MTSVNPMVPPTTSTYHFFIIEHQGSAVIARPVDVFLQGSTLAEMIKLELMQIGDNTGCPMLVLDFENVKLVSSSIISSLLSVKRYFASRNVSFKMCRMNDSVRYVFRTLNMDGPVFDIVEDIAAALASSGPAISYYDVCGVASPPDEESA